MKSRKRFNRILSFVLVLTMLVSASPLTLAAGSGVDSGRQSLSFEKADGASADVRLETPSIENAQEQLYEDADSVRVSIVLEDAPTLKLFSTENVAQNASAMAYREGLKAVQETVSDEIEDQILDGENLDVVWNMTLAANIISANVEYGQIEDIAAMDGVAKVVIETSYDPLADSTTTADTFMTTSSGMIGAGSAWASGYTGAGTRIAIIDTGIDYDHQSFDSAAYLYSLEQQAAKKGMQTDAYIESLDLLTADDVTEVIDELNVYPYVQYVDGTANGDYYISEKIPFAINYVDGNYQVDHEAGLSEHGSHVAGIAAANSYISDGNGGYGNALETVYTQGVAPDAQIIVMKVFSTIGGGAYDSDYMAAIEDAILLGCDVVNLSLGGNKGFARSQLYQDILDSLEKSNTVVTMAAGNSGNWAENASTGYLYADDIDLSMLSAPAAATNSMAVASVENVGTTDYYISVDDSIIYYNLGVVGSIYTDGLNVLTGGDYDFIYIDGLGTTEDLDAVRALAGEDMSHTILVCSRGEINFSVKAQNAADYGFAGVIIYNNTADGSFSMNLEGYTGSIPCVSITQADAAVIKAAAQPVTDAEDSVVYYKGTMYVSDEVKSTILNSSDYNMSDFSSWGVAGSLELKPEISAPGGTIYSVDGSVDSGDAYELMSGTSMASPQVAGMAAVIMQYIQENGLEAKTGLTARQLTSSLLMSTATAITDDENGGAYYPVLQQGAGLANLGDALQASTYIKMDDDATSGADDGKVKAELGDDPSRTGVYTFGFTVNNFSDTPKTYSLSSDFFTQDTFESEGISYLDTYTTLLSADVSYTVDSESLTVSSTFECDLNADYVTDAKDAQIILDYSVGSDVEQYLTAINAKADLNGDGDVNTYDAHILLASLRSGYFQVEAGDSVHVQVSVALTGKDALDAAYPNGAYVEGYVNVESAPSAEGEVDPDHSIPVLGFYGNWSDASMYERADYEDHLYYENGKESDFIYPYTGGLNYLTIFDEDDNEDIFIGNPYLVEDTFPEGKAAISSKSELGDFVVTLIRNAGGFLFYIKDETTGELVHTSSSEQLNAAYYYENSGAWVMVNAIGLSIWQTPKQYGLEEGDVFTVGFMSVPEYYETDGALSTEDLVALMDSGELGEGVHHTRTFTVDDTDPVISSVEKDEETGNLIISAKDNQYIAAVAVLNEKGSNVLTISGVEQDTANTDVQTVIDMSEAADLIDGNCMVMVADYAGNETYYTVYGYNEGVDDYAGRMYAFTNVATRGTKDSWMQIVVDSLYYASGSYGGTTDVANMEWSVSAAEYVDGYVFMVSGNKLYVAKQGDWENYSLVATDSRFSAIKDMAYDYSTNTLYALGGTATENVIYSISTVDGTLTEEYTVSLSFPRYVDTSVNCELLSMTIDDEGNFYAINCGNTSEKRVYLFKWSASDVADGQITDLAPVNNTEDGYVGYDIYTESYDTVISDNVDYAGNACTQSMAWDHDNDVLYWAGSVSSVSLYNILYVLDTTTGQAAKAVKSVSGQAASAASTLCANVAGLYIVPASGGTSSGVETATGIQLSSTELTLLEGAEYQLGCDVFPWNLLDKSVTWTSSDETVAEVDKDGLVTAVTAGTTVITATTNAEPKLTATCTLTVEAVKGIDLSALLYDENGAVKFVKFNTLDSENWTVLNNGETVSHEFVSGAVLAENDALYMHDGDHMYAVDANTFAVTDYGYIDPTWQWSDAAPAPSNSTDYFGRIVGIVTGGCALGVMNVETTMGYEITHYSLFKNDPMALIAYKGACTHTDEYGTYDAYEYYVLTEGGKLYTAVVWAFYDEDAMVVHYTDAFTYVGATGLRLTGVSDTTSGRFGSMYYDAENDYLIVSAYTHNNANDLYVFDPDVCAPTKLGTFGDNVWPVTALYDYEQITELTVKVKPFRASIYVDETYQLTSRVYAYENSSAVTWQSMDETIATVDANGVVTGVGAGTVEIRAYSVEGDVYGSATITVKPLTSLDLDLHAYITTSEGGKWVSIDGTDLSYDVLSTSTAAYTGAGVANGKVYATDKTYYYEIDPSNDYAVTRGDNFTDANGAAFMSMLDGTSVPAGSVELLDSATDELITVEVGGEPVYLSAYAGDVDSENPYHYLTILHDYKTGSFSAAAIDYTYNPAAVAHYKSAVIEDYYYFDFYYVLGYDGIVESYSLYSAYADGERASLSGGWEDDFFDTGLEFEDGDDVSMVYVNNDVFTGLIISHATASGTDLYCFDLVKMELGKLGTIAGATDLVGLSLMSQISGETEYYKDVTFKVVNGTWSDGTAADKTVKVALKDENGEWSENGTGTLEIPTGMTAAEGFEGGSWDVEPTGTVTGTEAVTYTYTFTEKATADDSLLAYIYNGSGYQWVKIDPTELTYEKLADGTLNYNGMGHSEGKMYGTYAASAWGAKTFYMVDPSAGYTDTAGYQGYGVYHMYDGAGAPAATVQLVDPTSGSLKDVEVGGYVAYISWQYSNYYMFALQDYTNAYGYTQFSFGSTLPAKPMGIAYSGSELSADNQSYTEKFVVLCNNGALVEVSVKTTIDETGTKYLNEDITYTTLTTLTIDGLSAATNASMARTGDDVYTISVAVSGGVALYSYDVTSDTLASLGLVEDFQTLVGLTLMADLGAESGGSGSEEPTPDPDPVVETKSVTFKVVNGTWSDGTTADIVETVELTDGTGTVTVPTGMIAAEGYESGSWDVEPSGTVTGTEAVTYTYTFTEKEEAPVVEYKSVTFKVVNGTWSDGTTADIVETVELTDGSGTVTVPTGMIAAEGYEGGSWDVEPTGTVTGTEAVTYTYTFTEKEEAPDDGDDDDGSSDSDGYVLIGYFTKSEKEHAWATLDTSDMSYELLTDWTSSASARLSGALVSDGKIYATRTSTSAINNYYYMYDPDNRYLSKKSSTRTTIKMADGTSAPVKSVEIVDLVTGTSVETAVGVPLYVRNDGTANYVTFLEDYSVPTDVSETLSYSDSKVLAVSYVSAELSEDATTYTENYVILFQDGMLYDYTVVYTVSDGTVSRTGAISSCVDTGLASKITFASDGTGGGSMALVEENILILSVYSSNSTGTVQLFKYDLSDNTLTLMGEVEGMITMVGLSLYSDITDASASGSSAFVGGTLMALPNSATAASASVAVTDGSVSVDSDKNTVTVTLTEDVDVTNGLMEVHYDPEVLTFVSAASHTAYYAVNGSEPGKVLVGYAAGEAISAGDILATLKFSYTASSADVVTDVSVKATERNDAVDVVEKAVTSTVTLPAVETEEPDTPVVPPVDPVDPPADDPVDPPADDPVDPPVDDPIDPPVDDPVDPPVDDPVEPDPCEHDYELTIDQLPTDTHAGQRIYTCTKCGYSYAEAISAHCYSSAFEDLNLDAWYHEYTDYVIGTGLMNGISETEFAPDLTLSRAMLATVLYRIAGEPEAAVAASFQDVVPGAWYCDAINWAAANGVVTGYSADQFGPDDPVTREQMATMLWRFAKSEGVDVSAAEETDILRYTDASQVSEYAMSAMRWACGSGIINGVTEDQLVPKGNATRAQVAAMLQRFCENVLH